MGRRDEKTPCLRPPPFPIAAAAASASSEAELLRHGTAG